ncbi:MAG: hypothetical protein HY814_08600 [Candidatus Riflebacteria bacterium]|nr:hypothetical protein [Candidatus Riflebacteria bacterium]
MSVLRTWKSLLTALVALLVLAASPAPALTLVFRVYNGPVDDPSKDCPYTDVELDPGSAQAKDFVDNLRQSNPELARAYDLLAAGTKLRAFLDGILALDNPDKKVILADDSRKYVDRDGTGKPDRDSEAQAATHVWPHSTGESVVISRSYLETYSSQEDLSRLLIHELSHTQDHTRLYQGDYGPDGKHYVDEVLRNQTRDAYAQNASWIEGWANFTPMLYDPGLRKDMLSDAGKLRREGESGKYSDLSWGKASYEERIATESVNALILHDLARLLPGGTEKVFAAFRATNWASRTLTDFMAEYVRLNPDQALAAAAIFDAYTGFAAPDSVLSDILGKDLADRYRDTFRQELRARNGGPSIRGAQDVAAYAAVHLVESLARQRLAAIERRLAELQSWRPSWWEIALAPAVVAARTVLNRREQEQLRAEREALQRDLERLAGARTAAASRSNATVLMLPTAAPLADEALPASSVGTAPPPPATRPAASFDGRPVSWGR